MSTPTNLSRYDYLREPITKDRAAAMSHAEITKAHGISVTVLAALVKQWGIPFVRKPNKPVPVAKPIATKPVPLPSRTTWPSTKPRRVPLTPSPCVVEGNAIRCGRCGKDGRLRVLDRFGDMDTFVAAHSKCGGVK